MAMRTTAADYWARRSSLLTRDEPMQLFRAIKEMAASVQAAASDDNDDAVP